ncbi:MAG: rnd [Hydrocarboniphaga sp.]|uniref:ribonuclease D n=1 Tax=Hydrocarboniphaga sp. TaxID=2033016 RepID=UPI00261D1F65|nr:ribonuclease D [Hydrocarboniphaga sp.]MDB5970892.1 rnd [Hydrocarboniphaga sp.]
MLIDTEAGLHAMVDGFAGRDWLTVDTEFVREETYWPQLCLIQVGDGRSEAAVDATRIEDLSPLLDLLQSPSCVSVFHAASQDLEIFVRLRGVAPTPVFDTQIAASLLGIGDQLGYAALIEQKLGIKVDKSLSRTNWARRPLSAAELTYAEDDVRHLAVIYPALRDELVARGRLSWLEEDCARLSRPERYRVQPDAAWERLKGLARLPAPAQHVAAALAAWRERLAETRDRPRKWILADDALFRIAERRPVDTGQLAALQVLPPKTLERHAAELLRVVAAARDTGAPALALEQLPSEAQKTLTQKLMTKVREIAVELGIPSSLLAPRADIEAVALRGAEAEVPLLSGWRREVAGEALLKL